MKFYIVTIFVFGILQVYLSNFQFEERTTIFISPSKTLKHFTFGYDYFLSSTMWVRVVQDFHICDQNSEKAKYTGPKEGVDPLEDALTKELPTPTCEEGWVYKMLEVISDLTPDFRRVYADGATMLSIIVDDRQGAKKIYDKGIKNFPEDWDILYRAAYHELFEMQNGDRAGELLMEAANRGAPGWVYSLAAKLQTRYGKAVLAKGVLEAVLARDRAGEFTERVQQQLDIINKTLEAGENPGEEPKK